MASLCRWNKYVVEESVDTVCHCGENHALNFQECPVRAEEVEIANIWAVHQVSCAEAVQIAEGASAINAPQPAESVFSLIKGS